MSKKMTCHHLYPKARGGTKANGTLYLWRDKHDCWHKLFNIRGKELTIDEVITLLHRIKRMNCKTHWLKEVQNGTEKKGN